MMRRVRRAGFFLAAVLTTGLVSACSGDNTVTAYPPYQYSYLPKIQLNVASVGIEDHAQPGTAAGDISAKAPIPPDQALTQVAQDRLVAAGQGGTALFTVDQSSILHNPDGSLTGAMTAHLTVTSATGQPSGSVEAHVSRRYQADYSKGDADSRGNLYQMTGQMLQDMNVELEYQIRNHLKAWLVDAGGMPVDGAISTQSLTGAPGTASVVPQAAPVTGAAASQAASEPDAVFPDGAASSAATGESAAAAGGRTLSPQPGYLHLPAGTATGH